MEFVLKNTNNKNIEEKLEGTCRNVARYSYKEEEFCWVNE